MSKKSNKSSINPLVAIGAIAGAATIATLGAKKLKNKSQSQETEIEYIDHSGKQVYFVGGGLGSLAGAAYLVRDCNFKGENIHIIEGMQMVAMMALGMYKMVSYVVAGEC